MFKEFCVVSTRFTDGISYYVGAKNQFGNKSRSLYIPRLLEIDFEQFEELMVLYGAKRTKFDTYFKNANDARRFVNYLNDTYLVSLKLQGKI